MRIQHVQRHLNGIESKPVLETRVEHLEVNSGVLVPREADISHLASLARGQRGLKGAVRAENAVRVTHPDHFVKLNEVNHVGLQTAERFIKLFIPEIL